MDPSPSASESLPRSYYLVVPVAVLLAHLSILVPVLRQPGRPPLRSDSAVFEYAGWFVARGGTLYEGLWEVKLPLAYETPALFALVVGNNPYLYHLVLIAASIAASILSAALIGLLARQVTGSNGAAYLGGLSLLLLPGYYYVTAFGYKAKCFVVLAGALSIWLAHRDRHVWSGAAAAAAVGYYQYALVFPLIAVGLGIQRARWRGGVAAVAGGLGFTALTFVPIAMAGALSAMVTETLLVPLVVDGGSTKRAWSYVLEAGRQFGVTAPIVGAGIVGAARALWQRPLRETWWVAFGGGWFAVVVLFVDYDNFPDLVPGLLFVAVGVALFYEGLPSLRWRRAFAGVLVLSLAVNGAAAASLGSAWAYSIEPAEPLSELKSVEHESEHGFTVVRPDVRYLFWRTVPPDTCHVRLSSTELRWLRLSGEPLMDSDCGDFADAIRLLRTR